MKFDLCSLVGTSQIFIVLTLDFKYMYQPDGNIFAGFAIYNMGFTKRGSDHVLNGLAFFIHIRCTLYKNNSVFSHL